MNQEEKNTLDQLIRIYSLSPSLRQHIMNVVSNKPNIQKIYFIQGCSRYTYNRQLKTITKTKSGCGCGR